MDNLFIRTNNRKNFLIGDIKEYHPKSVKYIQYWSLLKKRCIEGLWSIDDENVKIDLNKPDKEIQQIKSDKWRWMTPNLFFYSNLGVILHNPEGSPKAAPKKKIRPDLRDIEWEFFYNWIEARGFSGFEDDDNYSCNRDLVDWKSDTGVVIKLHSSCYKKDGTLKEYIPARKYLRSYFDRPMGLPLYENDAKDLLVFGSRGTGKSFWVAVGVILWGILFDEAKKYDDESKKNPYKVEILVGASIASKSAELMGKAYEALLNLPGEYAKGTKDYKPSPLSKRMAGSIKPNNGKEKWRHEYMEQSGNDWFPKGSGSNVNHVVYTMENPEAGAGGRYTYSIVEEVGLCFGKGTKIRLYNGDIKNVEDIHKRDIIMGHDGCPRTIEGIISGEEDLYEVEQKFGDNYIVSKNHILYLEQKCNVASIKDDGLKKILVQDFNEEILGKYKLRTTYGIKNNYIDINKNYNLELDPYYVGMFIGDGSIGKATITGKESESRELVEWLKNYVQNDPNYKLQFEFSKRDGYYKGFTPTLIKRGRNNKFRQSLKSLGLFYKKFIPKEYLMSSKENRLKLLAGLLDTDGCLVNKGKSNQAYEFYQTEREDLVDDVAFLAKSLGFKVDKRSRITNKGYGNKIIKNRTKYALRITGDIWEIPCLLERKKAIPRIHIKDFNRTSIKVNYIGKGKYYGFKLKENPLFLLKDGTIVHNCENVLTVHGSNEATLKEGTTKFGSALYLGTGGNVEKVQETSILFYDPAGFGFLEFDDVWEGSGKIGWFIPVEYALNQHKDKNGNTNYAAAKAEKDKDRESKKKSKSNKALDLEMMNYPMIPSEMFLNAKGNRFPVSELKARLGEVKSKPHIYENAHYFGELVWVEGNLEWKNTSAADLVRKWPIIDNSDLPGVIELFEMPKKDAKGRVFPMRYIQGTDTYDDDESLTGSLGSTFVFDLWTNRIVAEYTGRRLTKEFYEICRKLNIFYGAKHCYENNKKGLFTYFDQKNCTHLLCDTPESLRDVANYTIGTIGNKSKGVNMTAPIIQYGLRLLESWLLEPAYSQDSVQNEEILNLHKIRSIGLLTELIHYKPEGNFDRISAMLQVMILKEDLFKATEKRITKQNYEIAKDSFFDKFKKPVQMKGSIFTDYDNISNNATENF